MKKTLLSLLMLSTFVFGQVPFQVKDIYPGVMSSGVFLNERPYVYKNGILFSGDNQTNSEELWFSDGTPGGTTMIMDIQPGGLPGSPRSFFALGTNVLFSGYNGIWTTDGTTIGTSNLSPYRLASPTGIQFTNINNIVYYSTYSTSIGTEMARTDGTTGGSFLLKDIWPGSGSSNPSQIIGATGSNLFFVANDGVNGEELWKSDGTTSGTQIVMDIMSGSGSSGIQIIKYVNNTLFFLANDGINGSELWRSDGTVSGTYLLKDLNPGPGNCSWYNNPIVLNNKLFFQSPNSFIWESDGTISGTFSSSNLFASPNSIGFRSNLYLHNNDIYFLSATTNTSLSSLDTLFFHKLTSTVSNVTVFKKLPLTSSVFYQTSFKILQSDNNKFLFIGDNSSAASAIGMSDGTSAGSSILNYTATVTWPIGIYFGNRMPFLNNEWYLPLTTPSNGPQIHRVNSNTGAITLTKNIGNGFPGPSSLWYFNWAILNNKLYFIANDGSTGKELWVSDGTNPGTFRTLDIYPGANGCIRNIDDWLYRPAVNFNKLFFVADDGVTGNELYCLIDGAANIIESSQNNYFSLYPNPTSKTLTIKTNSKTNSPIEIINYLGQTVLKQPFFENIDVSKLNPGCYFIRIDNSYSKFIKE